MWRRIIGFMLVVIFICTTSYVSAQTSWKERRDAMKKTMADKTQVMIDELTTELNLTPEQVAKFKEILANSAAEIKKVLEEVGAEIKEIRVKANDEFQGILTEEQKQKFQELRQKYETSKIQQ